MKPKFIPTGAAALLAFLAACSPPPEPTEDNILLQIGSVQITESDIEYQLQEKHEGKTDQASRQAAISELTKRAHHTQAAIDEGIVQDPVVRAEIARILKTRLKEKLLYPKLKNITVPESRLRELFVEQKQRFQSPEKRQLAVLWLNPGTNPERAEKYKNKLSQARDWFFKNTKLDNQPTKGFSVLSVDHSEHVATRFKGGILGWLEKPTSNTTWTSAVAEIGFSLKTVGEVSPVITNPEGVFLVRLMATKAAVQKPFKAVRAILIQEEQASLRKQLETDFEKEIMSKQSISR